MKKSILRFPSGRLFQVMPEMTEKTDKRRTVIVFFDHENLKRYFQLDSALDKNSAHCLMLYPTRLGIKTITRREGVFLVMVTSTEAFAPYLTHVKDMPDYLILCEDESGRSKDGIDIEEGLCLTFQVPIKNVLVPASYSPFLKQNFFIDRPPSDEQFLSLGPETRFSIASLAGRALSISPLFGELENLTEMDRMDTMVGELTGHQDPKKITLLKDNNRFSFLAEYASRFPHGREIPHLYSHFAAALYDRGLSHEKALGVIYDTEALDETGNPAGSEIMFNHGGHYTVEAGWKPIPLPGGEIANIEPWRITLAVIREATGIDLDDLKLPLLDQLHEKGNHETIISAINTRIINTTPSSSMHHIIAALGELLAFEDSTYELDFFENRLDQAYIEQEGAERYPVEMLDEDGHHYADTYALFRGILQDVLAGMDKATILQKAVATIAALTARMLAAVAEKRKIKKVVFSGEFFTHPHFLSVVLHEVEKAGLEPLLPLLMPVDDSVVAVGQIFYHTSNH